MQTHCHHHAVMGYEADRAALEAAGVETDVLDSGCCGLAGNFGFEEGHYEVSGHCAPHQHLAVAAATPNLRHLEWFHDHVRIEHMLFDGTRSATGGSVVPDRDSPGTGYTFRRADAERFRVA